MESSTRVVREEQWQYKRITEWFGIRIGIKKKLVGESM